MCPVSFRDNVGMLKVRSHSWGFSLFTREGCYHTGRAKIGNSVPHVVNSPCSTFESNRVLKHLSKEGRIDEARKLFDEMLDRDEYSWNTMVAAYATSGRLDEAKELFEETPIKSSVTWSSLISGYCRHGCPGEGFKFFWRMQLDGQKPTQFSLGSVLRACALSGSLQRGKQIHGYAMKTNFGLNDFVVTGLVDMYAKCRSISEAEYLFATVSERSNHALWSAMITAYSQNGDAYRAMMCVKEMRKQGIEFDEYSLPSILATCAAVSADAFGAQVHCCIIRSGYGLSAFVQSALVDMYAKCGDLSSAKLVIEATEIDSVVSWNSMIMGCMRQECEEEALYLFKKMHGRDMKIDDFTYTSVLKSLASMMDLKLATSVHCLILKTRFEAYRLVSNALIDMYAKQREITCACEVFKCLLDKDVISWTSLVTGYAHNGFFEEALRLFCDMTVEGIYPDEMVVASILSASAELTALEFGQQVHGIVVQSGFLDSQSSTSVGNSLISMYARCGCIEDADRVFNSMQVHGLITWTALIMGYARNGKAKESLQSYNRMIAGGVKPDYISFIGLLFACSHACLVQEGRMYFESMTKTYGIKPGPEHYASMIDLLGRSGKLAEAEELLNQMSVEPDPTIWKALLAACRVHKNLELGERAARNLFKLEPMNSVPYVLLANIYFASGKLEEAAKIWGLMKSRGINKEPGCSWVGINGRVHTFVSEDRGHPRMYDIYLKIDEVMQLIKKAGYVPDLSSALHDVDEEGKELGLAYHSEKLAVAFGLLAVPHGGPIRIYKNLRVCGDCHVAMRYISQVFSRHIVLRDSNRFHHFREGVCSCGDYW
ncbi:putative pentatricopeptide repeat-containing protein At5g52630 [Rhodamnia argentea]|uniref:Pentatricopeptide repeat-containing protein At5g52630 n=1 Tax=Rhodamnia argentea TaxID=178133 RepID=A0A8B8NM12_9MYRT|nr:putative pentatricopeptide repeat-containing protein At5g52630 [Rhodamnia argentea]